VALGQNSLESPGVLVNIYLTSKLKPFDMIRLQWIALYVVQALNIPKQNNFHGKTENNLI